MSAFLLNFGQTALGQADDAVLVKGSEIADKPSLVRNEITERGQNFAVYQQIERSSTSPTSEVFTTNRFTLLENNLHYLDQGEWRLSEDVLEVTAEGAVARRGPTQAIFSPELNTESVFDLETAGADRIRGGVRMLQLTDTKSGESIILGKVKASVKGQLLPPNQVLYAYAFDGLSADVVLIWKHNLFAQDIVLRERPKLPANWTAKTVRLEVVTEFISERAPEISSQNIESPGEKPRVDDTVIKFGSLDIVLGKAVAVGGDRAVSLGDANLRGDGVSVQKESVRSEDGRRFLIESVRLEELEPQLKALSAQAQPIREPMRTGQILTARTWPKAPQKKPSAVPMTVANFVYRPIGALVDFIMIPGNGTAVTFLTGETYYIQSGYIQGNAVTFQPGCTLKYKDNAYFIMYGSITTPTTGMQPVFTSRNDNNYGDRIQGVPGEADSNGDPFLHRANPAIWIYYVNTPRNLTNLRIRWAKIGLQIDQNGGVTAAHTLQNSWFEHFVGSGSTAVGFFSASFLTLYNVKKCNVANAGATPMTEDCGVVYNTMINKPVLDTTSGDPNKNSQTEASFVVIEGQTPGTTKIVCSFFDTHRSAYGLGNPEFSGITSPRSSSWAVSYDGGATFANHAPIPPSVPSSIQLVNGVC